MGHELYRMIRDGAPASWTPAMRMVAMVIADDALDPSQHEPADGGWPRSAIRVRGGRSRSHGGEWYDGITERTGMSERAISRALTALARADFEMREQIGTDKRRRPVFAYPGRTPRFRVPPLTARGSPPGTATSEARQVRRPSEARQVRRPRKVAKYGDHGSPPNMASKVAKSGELQTLLPNPSNPTSPDLQVVNSNLEGDRGAATTDDDDDFNSICDKLGATERDREIIRSLAAYTGDLTGYVRQYAESADGGQSFMSYVRRVLSEADTEPGDEESRCDPRPDRGRHPRRRRAHRRHRRPRTLTTPRPSLGPGPAWCLALWLGRRPRIGRDRPGRVRQRDHRGLGAIRGRGVTARQATANGHRPRPPHRP